MLGFFGAPREDDARNLEPLCRMWHRGNVMIGFSLEGLKQKTNDEQRDSSNSLFNRERKSRRNFDNLASNITFICRSERRSSAIKSSPLRPSGEVCFI
mmetsp:Transcript_29343/g.33516  ORF Transcript_29343/g.33516 Transcript_29343/m.33516 type:complete len:98 (+) Transcript_29343:648-941(+)